MINKRAVSRLTVALSAAAVLTAAVPAVAPAKSVKVKNGTYKGSILANSGDEGSDFRTPVSVTVKKNVLTKIVFSKFTLWAANQPASVSTGGAPQACQQAGTAPGSTFTPTITVNLSDGTGLGPFVKVTSRGSFAIDTTWGLLGSDSAVTSVIYATTGNAPARAGETELNFSGRFSNSGKKKTVKAKGRLTSMSIKLGEGIEQFTCNSYWAPGQTWPWGIPSAPR